MKQKIKDTRKSFKCWGPKSPGMHLKDNRKKDSGSKRHPKNLFYWVFKIKVNCKDQTLQFAAIYLKHPVFSCFVVIVPAFRLWLFWLSHPLKVNKFLTCCSSIEGYWHQSCRFRLQKFCRKSWHLFVENCNMQGPRRISATWKFNSHSHDTCRVQ